MILFGLNDPVFRWSLLSKLLTGHCFRLQKWAQKCLFTLGTDFGPLSQCPCTNNPACGVSESDRFGPESLASASLGANGRAQRTQWRPKSPRWVSGTVTRSRGARLRPVSPWRCHGLLRQVSPASSPALPPRSMGSSAGLTRALLPGRRSGSLTAFVPVFCAPSLPPTPPHLAS